MKIKLHEITIKDIAAGYIDSGEDGVLGYNGKLNIRHLIKENLFMMIKNVKLS